MFQKYTLTVLPQKYRERGNNLNQICQNVHILYLLSESA